MNNFGCGRPVQATARAEVLDIHLLRRYGLIPRVFFFAKVCRDSKATWQGVCVFPRAPSPAGCFHRVSTGGGNRDGPYGPGGGRNPGCGREERSSNLSDK